MSALASTDRRALRARAHHLEPVVSIGQHGLTPTVQHEIDVALTAHELVKIRVHNDSRAEREAMLAGICDALSCAPVQHLGKLLIVWRPNPDKAPKAADRKPAAQKSSRRAPGTGRTAEGAEARAKAPADTRQRPRGAARDGNAAVPSYFSRRGAGRFVADNPQIPATRRRGRGG